MSYDVFLFQLHEDASTEEINEFLQSNAFTRYCDKRYQNDEDGDEDEDFEDDEDDETGDDDEDGDAGDDDELPPIPPQFINMRLREETLQHMIYKALLKTARADEEWSEEVEAYLNSEDEELPEELEEDFELFFEYSPMGHMQPLMFSYSGDLGEALGWVAGILEALRDERIAAYDPQISMVVDGDNAKDVFQESGDQARAQFNHLIASIQAGDDEDETEDEQDEEENGEDGEERDR